MDETCDCEDLQLTGSGGRGWCVAVKNHRSGLPFMLGDPSKLIPGMKTPDYDEAEWVYMVEDCRSRGEAAMLAFDHITETHPDRDPWDLWFVP